MAAALRPVEQRPTHRAPDHALHSAQQGLASIALLGALAALPMLAIALAAVGAAADGAAWRALVDQPQWPRATAMSLWTGLAATALSLLVSAWLLCRLFPGPAWQGMVRWLAPLLAVPHAAFAIGLAFLVAPSGWLLRLLSPWATGLQAPPPWSTTQDPWGLGLIAVLVCKEVPFLLWTAATQLQRADVAQRLSRELALAQTMGYARHRAWWRVVWPQLWPRMWAPLLAVLAYSLTVVDMALVIGPLAPPTLAVLTTQWLLDADPAVNAMGATAAWSLAILVGAAALALWPLPRVLRWRALWTDGRRGADSWHPARQAGTAGRGLWVAWLALYATVLLALAASSVAGVWPFPLVLPQSLSLDAWQSVAASARTLWTTLGLAAAAAATALAWSLAWLECAPARWDQRLRRLLYLPLVLPSVLWVVGLHGLAVHTRLDTQWVGLWLAHALAALPYVLIALSPAYLGFDPRHAHVAASLGHSHASFLWRVKWPLLRAAITSALAVGFAVSVAQYLPTLFIGAGRFNTVTTEAVTLASGAQRSLSAAYAWLQWLLPALAFALAAWWGRPRRFGRTGAPGAGARAP